MSKCGAKCEIYSRVCGYFRPVSNWNKGKKEEFKQRKNFKIPAVVVAVFAAMPLFCGCTVNITNNGENAKFELSPARNIYPDTSVMNGFSLIPRSGESETAEAK